MTACVYCGRSVIPTATGTFQKVVGWVENRDAGGANTVALMTRYSEYACGECIDKMRHGIAPTQGSLL